MSDELDSDSLMFEFFILKRLDDNFATDVFVGLRLWENILDYGEERHFVLISAFVFEGDFSSFWYFVDEDADFGNRAAESKK